MEIDRRIRPIIRTKTCTIGNQRPSQSGKNLAIAFQAKQAPTK